MRAHPCVAVSSENASDAARAAAGIRHPLKRAGYEDERVRLVVLLVVRVPVVRVPVALVRRAGALVSVAAVPSATARCCAASLRMRRLFRRAAWFLWMTPLFAAASRFFAASATAVVASVASPDAIPSRAFRTYVRSADLTERLRIRRRSETRCAFIADRLFANHLPPERPRSLDQVAKVYQSSRGVALNGLSPYPRYNTFNPRAAL